MKSNYLILSTNMKSLSQIIKPDSKLITFDQYMNIYSDNKIIGGIHRFCLRINGISLTNDLSKFKFGISSIKTRENEKKCFSDEDTGFAFYSLGQTRNGSINSGLPYEPCFQTFGNIQYINK